MGELLISDSDSFFSYRQSKSGANVEWKVNSFSTLKEKFITSPRFSFQKVDWFLTLYPNGNREDSSGYVELFLEPRLSFPSKLRYRFFFKDESNRDTRLSCIIERNFSDGFGYGKLKYFRRQDLLDGRYGNLLSGDTLTVCCALKTAESTETETPEGMNQFQEKFVLKLGTDSFPSKFQEVFDNGTFSDVMVRIGKETIPAHKVILSTQSSVFKAMFENDMKECRENTVDLIDIDETVAKVMLLYMYTREVEGLSAEKTLDLYAAADRYMLPELKKNCRKFISENMLSKNVGDVFELANLHSDNDLLESALKFFAMNVGSILQTNEWKEFSNLKPASSVKLLTHAITI